MANMRYIDDQWRYTAYVGCAIVVIFSISLALLVGHYRFDPRYLVPVGTGYRNPNTTWTLLGSPFPLPSGPSAALTDTTIAIGLVIALLPVVFASLTNYRYLREVERNIPRFLRDILESTDSGLILPKALIEASKTDYGPISHEIGIAMTKFSLGYDFKSSVMEAAERLRHPFMPQVGLILAEAYAAGGKIHDVLNSSVALFNGLEQYNEEKQSELRPYTQLVYISIIIFLAIALIVISQFISPFEKIAATATGVGPGPSITSGGIGQFNLGKVPTVTYFESIFFVSALLESLFGAIVAGKIVDGSAMAGLRHAIVLIVITILVFNLPVVGIFGVG